MPEKKRKTKISTLSKFYIFMYFTLAVVFTVFYIYKKLWNESWLISLAFGFIWIIAIISCYYYFKIKK